MNPQRFLVTGAGGFVGKALCKKLLSLGHRVVALGRRRYPDLIEAGAEQVLADVSALAPPYPPELNGVDGVFHVAAKVEMWGRREDFYLTNVVGTKNVIDLCRACSIPRLVYTSSPSVVADGTDLRGIDEHYPYPNHYHAFYPETKAAAERLVVAANNPALATLSLRPHLIFGPGDQHLIPTVIAKARAGRLRIVGPGTNRSDFTFIDDCVAAHVLAMEALRTRVEARGRAYFISQGDPYPLWKWIGRVLEAANLPPLKSRVPVKLAMGAASVAEAVWRTFGIRSDPPLTKFLVSEMATEHFFSIEAARSLIGYTPKYTVDEGLDRTFAAWEL